MHRLPKRLLIGGILLAGGLGVLAAQLDTRAAPKQADQNEEIEEPESDHEKAKLAKFMRKKLNAAEKILEGLVIEDFGLIRQGAAQLKKMSSAEQWRVSNNALYRQYSGEFRRKVERLEDMAKEKKLEGAALTYLEVTMSCLECHKYVRATLIADDGRTGPPTDGLVQSARQLERNLAISPEAAGGGSQDEASSLSPSR